MERRILVNYRADAHVLAEFLPAPFRPALVDGHGIAGICLIKLASVRPPGLWPAAGLTSENAAHRVAVQWDTPAGPVNGVYVPRRDTSSLIVSLAGGRLFPGWQHLANFNVEEDDDRFWVRVRSRDGAVHIIVAAHRTDRVMAGSTFADLEAASQFFRCAPVGYAATPAEGVFDGVELYTNSWNLTALQVDEARSSIFDDPTRFPAGSIAIDSAFLMSGLTTTWHRRPRLFAASDQPSQQPLGSGRAGDRPPPLRGQATIRTNPGHTPIERMSLLTKRAKRWLLGCVVVCAVAGLIVAGAVKEGGPDPWGWNGGWAFYVVMSILIVIFAWLRYMAQKSTSNDTDD
jgi:hypothetical protein